MVGRVINPETPEMAAYRDALKRNRITPWGEFFLEPKDVAHCIAFVVSDGARGVQETTIMVDHGHTSALPPLPV